MAGQLLLINPRKRRAGTKRRSAAQKAATARLVAMNRARRGGAVAKRKTRAKRSVSRSVTRYARNPAPAIHRKIMRHRRRNPHSLGTTSLGFTTGKLLAAAKNAGIAAGGALAVDYAYGFVKSYLPASVQAPVDSSGAINPLYYLAKGLAAVGLGVLGSKVVGMRTATKMAEGSLVITAYSALRNMLPASMSGSLGYYQPAVTDTPNLPGSLNTPNRTQSGSITDMRAYLSQGSRMPKGRTAYDNQKMSAYLSR